MNMKSTFTGAQEIWTERLDQVLAGLGKDGNPASISANDLFNAVSGDRTSGKPSVSRDRFAQAMGERIADGRVKVDAPDLKTGATYSTPVVMHEIA